MNTIEVPTFPFVNTVGCVTDVFRPGRRLRSSPAKPTALTTPGFPSAAFTFLQKSLFFFDKTEASHSHKMHKKTTHNKFKNTTVTVQIEPEQLTEQSHVKHVEEFTAKTHNTNTPMNTRTNVTIVYIFFCCINTCSYSSRKNCSNTSV